MVGYWWYKGGKGGKQGRELYPGERKRGQYQRMLEKAIRDHIFSHLKIIYNTYMYMYIHREVKRSYAIWVDNAAPNNHKTNKKPQYQMWGTPFWVLGHWVQETIKTIYATAIADGCLPKVEGRFLLVKASCMLDTGRRIWAGSDLKASTLRMSFHRIWSWEVSNSPTQLWHLGSTIVWDIPKGIIVALIILEVTNNCLILVLETQLLG